MRKKLTPRTIQRSRELRTNQTDAERLLWWKLRELHKLGFNFRRQFPMRGYILDFVELSAKLIIELDGYQHGTEEHRVRDEKRDENLTRGGYLVLRFSNTQIFKELNVVVDFVLHEAERRRPSGPTPP